MTHTTTKLIAALSIAGLTLVGCGSTEAQEAPEQTVEQPEATETQNMPEKPEGVTQEEWDANLEYAEEQGTIPDTAQGMGIMEAGEYEIHPLKGGYATFQIPTDPSHEAVAPYEEYRTTHNLDPVTYLAIDTDNRDGTEMLKFTDITVYDEDGNAYTFEHIQDATTHWEPVRSWDSENEEYWNPNGETISFDEYLELENQYRELTNDTVTIVNQAERATILLAYEGDDLPDEFTRVSTAPYGIGTSEDAYPTDY